MTGRERFLTVLNNGKPDRMPCQVHSWMQCYLKKYLNGMDQYQAYEYFGMDPVAYVSPNYLYSKSDLEKWQVEEIDLGIDQDGNRHRQKSITTPEGTLTEKRAFNEFTGWVTEHIIKDKKDFEIWNKYMPIPKKLIGARLLRRKGLLEITAL